MPSQVIMDCSKLMRKLGYTIAFAESATAGRMSSEFALTPESGDILKGGLVCYDARVKEDILKIPADLVEKYTPESAEVTVKMASQLKELINADIHIATTGLTRPGGSETPEKPVGTIFIHLLIHDRPVPLRRVFTGLPEEIMLQAIDLAALSITMELEKIEKGEPN